MFSYPKQTSGHKINAYRGTNPRKKCGFFWDAFVYYLALYVDSYFILQYIQNTTKDTSIIQPTVEIKQYAS